MKKLLFLTIIFLSSLTLSAKYTQTCQIKYKKNYGWSQYYSVEVNFMTGTELNRATKTYNYDSYALFAVVFWDNDQATVIKISSYVSCGYEATQRCISGFITNLAGEDQEGRNWEICTGSFCY